MVNTTDLTYKIEMNVTGGTTGWLLDISALGSGAILRDTATLLAGATLVTIPNFLEGTIKRGRQDELGTFQAGAATLVMDNRDGRYSPGNSASPYYPSLVPGRQVRVSASYKGGAWISLYVGYVQEYLPHDDGPYPTMRLVCADWLAKAANADLNLSLAAQLEWARFNSVVTSIGTDGLPVAYDAPSYADTTLATTYTGIKGLQAINDLTEAFRGSSFHGRDGTITYRTRYWRWQNPGAFAAGYVFDQSYAGAAASPVIVPYEAGSLDYSYGIDDIRNEVRITPATGEGVQTASDGTSQTLYGRRTYSRSYGLLSTGRAGPLASTLLYAYKEPQVRIRSILVPTAAVLANAAQAATLLGLEIGNTARVIKRRPANDGIDRTMWIEGITHTIKPRGGHEIALQLSDTRRFGKAPWVLGTSQLGINTSLAW